LRAYQHSKPGSNRDASEIARGVAPHKAFMPGKDEIHGVDSEISQTGEVLIILYHAG
jgi:hypothetical protein